MKFLKELFKTLGICALALAVYISATGISFKNVNFVKEGTVPLSEMNSDDIYEATDMIVVDLYASYSDYDDYKYYLIAVFDNNDVAQYATLVSDNTSNEDLYNKLYNYAYDEEMYVGDFVIDGYFSVSRMEELDFAESSLAELKGYYNEAVSNYQQIIDAKSTDLVFQYKCGVSELDDYKEELKAENIATIIIAGAFALVGLLFIVLFAVINKKQKAKIEEYESENAEYYDPSKSAVFNADVENTALSDNSNDELQNTYALPINNDDNE